MHPLKGIDVPIDLVFPGLTKKLLRPSYTEGTSREYGIGTSQTGKPLLFFTLNANSYQTWIKQSKNFFSLLSLRTLLTTNAFMRYATTYLADLRIHHYLLAYLTKI